MKNLFALYGIMRMLEDIANPSQPPKKNNDELSPGCGCLLIIIAVMFFAVLISNFKSDLS